MLKLSVKLPILEELIFLNGEKGKMNILIKKGSLWIDL